MSQSTPTPARPEAGSPESHRHDSHSPKSSHWTVEYVGNLRRISKEARWFLLGNLLVSFAWSTFMLLFNLYLQERGFAEGTIGQVLSSQSFGTVFLALPAATLVARLSPRLMMTISALGVAGAFAWQTYADGITPIIIAAFAAGMMLAFGRVMSSPYLMKYSTTAERSHVFSLSFAVMLGAGIIAHFGAGSLHRYLSGISGSDVIGYRWVLSLACISAALAVVAYSRIPSAIVGQLKKRATWREFWPTRGKMLFRLTLPSFIIGLGAGLIIPFLNLYFRNRFGLSTQMIGFYYGMAQTSMVLGVMIGPELARRFGMVRTIVATEIASLPFMVILAFSHNLPLVTVAFLIRGALMNLGVPIANNYVMERVGSADRALANSWQMLAWTLSWALMAGMGGWMIENWGFELPLLISSGLYVVASIIYFKFFGHEEIYAGKPVDGALRPGDE